MHAPDPNASSPNIGLPVVLTIGALALALAAFWSLLGCRFTAESNVVVPVLTTPLEWGWFAVALGAALLLLLHGRQHPGVWPDLLRGLSPLAVVSLVVVARQNLGAVMSAYDALAFCAAAGAGVWLLSRSGANALNPTILTWSVVIFGVALSLYYFCQQYYYWKNLALGYADCGEYARMLFNTACHPGTAWMCDNPGVVAFWDHFQPGGVLLAPLWWVWPHFSLVIGLQVAAILGAAVPLYWIGAYHLRDRSQAVWLAVAWLVYPTTSLLIYDASYGFRWGNFCLPLELAALACWLRGRKGWALVLALVAVLLKEEAAVVIGMFGVYLVLFEKERLAGVVTAALGLGGFLFITSKVIPAFNPKGTYIFLGLFADLGRTKWEILLSPLVKPAIFWGRLFDSHSLFLACQLLAPLLFLPIRKPSVLFAGLLTFVFICEQSVLKNPTMHYLLGLLPVIFWALTRAVADCQHRRAALWGVIAAGGLCSLFFGNAPWSKPSLSIPLAPGRLALIEDVAADIRPEDSVYMTQRAAAHFVTQNSLYVRLSMPATIDGALLDLQDHWRDAGGVQWLETMRALQAEITTNAHLHLTKARDGVLYYSRRGAPLDARQIIESAVLPPGVTRTAVPLMAGVQVLGIKIDHEVLPQEAGAAVRVTAYSTVTAKTNADLAVRCCVIYVGTDAETNVYASAFQPLGQGILPVAKWAPGNFYADPFIVPVPAELARVNSQVQFEVLPLTTAKPRQSD